MIISEENDMGQVRWDAWLFDVDAKDHVRYFRCGWIQELAVVIVAS